jgi:serine/threonine protein kinase
MTAIIKSDEINNSNRSKLLALNELKNDKFDTIEKRIECIKLLLNCDKEDTFTRNNNLNLMVNFDVCDTENFENRSTGYDIRKIMNKETMNFNKLINHIGGKLLYIKSGTTGHTFKGIIYDTDGVTELFNYAVKVVAYPIRENYGDVNDVKRPENAELMMLKLLSYFVVKGGTPHIVLPITTFNTDIRPFIALFKKKIIENKKYEQFVKRYSESEYHDNVSILISEWANGGDLLDYIKSNYKEMKVKVWRVIFFQIISVLAVIQNKYPSFRHNDLKANNILVQKIENKVKDNFFQYNINLKNDNGTNEVLQFIIPNIGIQIKLWDFDFACIPGVVENTKVSSDWTNKINVRPVQNRYYDLHYFFNTLTKKGFFPEFYDKKVVPSIVQDFVKSIIPSELFNQDNQLVTDRGRILANDEYTTPAKILKTHKFFDKMRCK